MTRPSPLNRKRKRAPAGRGWEKRPAFAMAIAATILCLFLVRGLQPNGSPQAQTRLSAGPSELLSSALLPDAVDFEPSLVQMIEQQGFIAVTVHVALHDRPGNRKGKFGDGANPGTNLYWGALFGLETHFANSAGWRRAYADRGDKAQIIRRAVFHKRAEPTPAWVDRGVLEGFDVYVLANAWPSTRIVEAMEQPIIEAVCGESIALPVDGRIIEFGGAGAMVGYLGKNHMLDEYWDPFVRLKGCTMSRQIGLLYLCPRSAVVLHQTIASRGLYSVLFTRSGITPEAYLLDGMLNALLSGELGDAFLTEAAAQYARFQQKVSPNGARNLLVR